MYNYSLKYDNRYSMYYTVKSRKIQPKIKGISDTHKIDLETGEVKPYDISDYFRKVNSFRSSLNRTLRRINEIFRTYSFRYFITMTFPETVDKSISGVKKRFDLIKKRLEYHFGKMSYIAIPEPHYSGDFHIHILCNFEKHVPTKFRGYTNAGFRKFTITTDMFRDDTFLTLCKLDTKADNKAVCEYLQKYIKKDIISIEHGRRYMTSRDITLDYVDSMPINEDDYTAIMNGSSLIDYYPHFYYGNGKYLHASYIYILNEQSPLLCGGTDSGGSSAPPLDLFISNIIRENKQTDAEFWTELNELYNKEHPEYDRAYYTSLRKYRKRLKALKDMYRKNGDTHNFDIELQRLSEEIFKQEQLRTNYFNKKHAKLH